MMRDRKAFERLRDKKVIINRSVLSQADVREFAREAGINIFYMVPAINDREESQYINELLIKLGMVKGKK
jgi:MinD superfamily P-loop ATPase